MSLTAQDIVIRPVISEKSMDEAQRGKYTFQVHEDANKLQIAAAVAELFKVEVVGVNVLTTKSKVLRGRSLMEAARTSAELRSQTMTNQLLVINGVFHAMDQSDALAVAFERRGTAALSCVPDEIASLPRAEIPLLGTNIVGLDTLRSMFTPQQTAASSTGLGLDQLFLKPLRPSFPNQFWPMMYSDTGKNRHRPRTISPTGNTIVHVGRFADPPYFSPRLLMSVTRSITSVRPALMPSPRAAGISVVFVRSVPPP